MNKYEIGYEDEFIGVYYGTTEEEAVDSFRQDKVVAQLHGIDIQFNTKNRLREKLIVQQVFY